MLATCSVPIVDITSGMICAIGILSDLVGRSTGHPVSHVSTSLLETALNLSVFQGQRALSLGETPVPQGNNHPTIAPYGTYATATDPSTSPSVTTSSGTLSARCSVFPWPWTTPDFAPERTVRRTGTH